VDLHRLTKGGLPLDGHALVATFGTRYSTRWGPWLLSGEFGRRPSLCLVDVDPSSVTDAFAQNPFAAAALFRRTYQIEIAARATHARMDGLSPAPLSVRDKRIARDRNRQGSVTELIARRFMPARYA
jgi:hypothetical protein